MDDLQLSVDGELTVSAAAGIHASWLAALDGAAVGRALRLDLSAVAEIDSAGVQLLLSLTRSAAEQGRALALQAPSAAVVEALGSFGLAELVQSHGAHAHGAHAHGAHA
jgi:anti-sigma B factor antagonist